VRITAIQVEMDGNDAGAMVRGLTEAMQGWPAQPAAEAVAAPVLALPAPANKRKKIYRKNTKTQRTAEGIRPKPPTVSDAIRMAVRDRGRTNEEVKDFVLAQGVETNSVTISTMLCQLRKRNEIYKDDRDLKWRKAERPE